MDYAYLFRNDNDIHQYPTIQTCFITVLSLQQTKKQDVFYDDYSTTTDVNECLSLPFPCGTNAKCINNPGAYRCECPLPLVGNPFDTCMREYTYTHTT